MPRQRNVATALITPVPDRSGRGASKLYFASQELITTYANLAGFEAGYGYFAPHVPGNCKLLFEVFSPDAHSQFDVPHVKGVAAGYRVATLLDYLQLFHSSTIREAILKPLVYECWKEHPEATSIRAIVATAKLPSIEQYRSGQRLSYDVSYSYDFQLGARSD